MYGVIYKTMNIVTRECYIGQSTRINMIDENLFPQIPICKRYIGSGTKMKEIIKEYGGLKPDGTDPFIAEILDTAVSQEELNNKENHWIQKLKPEYNSMRKCTGPGAMSQETIDKMLISQKINGEKQQIHHFTESDYDWILKQIKKNVSLKKISTHFGYSNLNKYIKQRFGKTYIKLWKEYHPEKYKQKSKKNNKGKEKIILDKNELYKLICEDGYTIKELVKHFNRHNCVIYHNTKTYWNTSVQGLRHTRMDLHYMRKINKINRKKTNR